MKLDDIILEIHNTKMEWQGNPSFIILHPDDVQQIILECEFITNIKYSPNEKFKIYDIPVYRSTDTTKGKIIIK